MANELSAIVLGPSTTSGYYRVLPAISSGELNAIDIHRRGFNPNDSAIIIQIGNSYGIARTTHLLTGVMTPEEGSLIAIADQNKGQFISAYIGAKLGRYKRLYRLARVLSVSGQIVSVRYLDGENAWTNADLPVGPFQGLQPANFKLNDIAVIDTRRAEEGLIGWWNTADSISPMLAADHYSILGLKSDGTVIGAGRNEFGEIDVSEWTDIREISSWFHTLGLNKDGTVLAVGYDGYGQLATTGWAEIKGIAANSRNSYGLKENGTVVGVGDNAAGQFAEIATWLNVTKIVAGTNHLLGLKSDGTVYLAGNSYGYSFEFDEYGEIIEYGYDQSAVLGWTGIVDLAAGQSTSYGLKADGTVIATGDPFAGQLEVGGWTDIVQISAKGFKVLGLKSDGTAVGAGLNTSGELNISSWSGLKQVVAGSGFYSAGLKEDNTVVFAGANTYGAADCTSWNLS